MPEHALYYPEWVISDPSFLAESLLYWDRLSCMVPREEDRELPWHEDEQVRNLMIEAHERFVSRLVPTDEQKARVHQKIKAFIELEPPEWCRPENLKPQHRQVISAYKFPPETLNLLRARDWVSQVPRSDNLHLQLIANAAANVLLGALAEECSSPTMPKVTDDPGSFSASCNRFLTELGAQHGLTFQERGIVQPPPAQDSNFSLLLLRIPHLKVDQDGSPAEVLRRILQARQDPDLEGPRKAFQRKVDEYLGKMRTVEANERSLFAQEFQDELERDLERFNRELRRTGLRSIVSKEGIVALMVGAATGALSLGLGLVLGLAGQLLAYEEKRREVFEKHWSSWVFSLDAPRLSIW